MPQINLNIKKNCNEEVPIMEATKTGGGKISVSQAFPKIIIQTDKQKNLFSYFHGH
jgi:hypothetical protein